MKKLALLLFVGGGVCVLAMGLFFLGGDDSQASASATLPSLSLPPNGSGHLTFSQNAAQDTGKIDPRLTALLAEAPFDLHIGTLITGHNLHVHGTDRISNHIYGRAADVTTVNSEPVSSSSVAAHAFMQWLTTADPQPTEVGSPFPEFNSVPGRFSDSDHRDHIHCGWKS